MLVKAFKRTMILCISNRNTYVSYELGTLVLSLHVVSEVIGLSELLLASLV